MNGRIAEEITFTADRASHIGRLEGSYVLSMFCIPRTGPWIETIKLIPHKCSDRRAISKALREFADEIDKTMEET